MGLPEYLMCLFMVQCFLQAYCLLKIMQIEKKQQEQLLVQINVKLLQEIVDRLINAERRHITPIVIEFNEVQSKPKTTEKATDEKKQEVEKTENKQEQPQEDTKSSQFNQFSQFEEQPLSDETKKKNWWDNIGDVVGAVRRMLPAEVEDARGKAVSTSAKEVGNL